MESFAITCGISCCCSDLRPQTKLSIGLRTTAVILGALALLMSILIICHISQVGNAAGWTTFSVGCLFIALSACIKAVKTRSIAYEEIKGIDLRALEAVHSHDPLSILAKYIALFSDLEENKAWALAVYQMILESQLDESGCHPVLHIGNFTVMDAICVETISTSDWFSTENHPCYPVALKKAVTELTQEQHNQVIDVLKGTESTDEQVMEVMHQIVALVEHLKMRYPLNRENIFLLIFNLIRTTIQELNINNEEDLSEYEIMKKISEVVAVKLLAYEAKVSDYNETITFRKIVLHFGMIEREGFWNAKIPNFFVNELTSFDYHDEPVVDRQPYTLALRMNTLDKEAKKQLLLAVKEGSPIDPTISSLLIPTASLILNRYYSKFLESYLKQSRSVPTKRAIKDKSLEYSKPSNNKVKNDLYGEKLDKYVKHFFVISKLNFIVSSNCILSAILKAIEPDKDYSVAKQAGENRVKEMRTQIADFLEGHKATFIEFFEYEFLFNQHIQGLHGNEFLSDVDFEALAQILNRPLYIYQQQVSCFFVNDNGEPIPAIFGTECTGSPIYLYEQGVHYDLLIRKS